MYASIGALAISLQDIDLRSYMPLFIILLLLGSVFMLFRLFHVSTAILWRLLINGLIGAFLLFIFDVVFYVYLGMEFFYIPITWVSAVVAGVLGIPGILLLLVLKILT